MCSWTPLFERARALEHGVRRRTTRGCSARARSTVGQKRVRRTTPPAADRDPGPDARRRRRALSRQALRRRPRRRSRPTSSATATTCCARSSATAPPRTRGWSEARDGARSTPQLGGVRWAAEFVRRHGRALGVHDRGLDRPLRHLARRARSASSRPGQTRPRAASCRRARCCSQAARRARAQRRLTAR